MKNVLIALLLVLPSISFANTIEQDVAVEKYNTFVLDKPYKTLFFEPGSPVSEPIPLIGNNGFLVRPFAAAQQPFQLIVELINGETVQFNLQPRQAASGYVYRRNAAGIFSEPEGQRARPSDKWIVDTFKSAILNKTPDGFMKEGKPKAAIFGDTVLLPVARFSNYIHELLIYNITSETAKEVQPKDFWHEGVQGVQIEGDIVSPKHSPTLLILREVNTHD